LINIFKHVIEHNLINNFKQLDAKRNYCNLETPRFNSVEYPLETPGILCGHWIYGKRNHWSSNVEEVQKVPTNNCFHSFKRTSFKTYTTSYQKTFILWKTNCGHTSQCTFVEIHPRICWIEHVACMRKWRKFCLVNNCGSW